MMDPHSEARLSEVLPKLADLVRQMAGMLESENIVIEVTQGLRTWEDQNSLYAIGRTLPGREVTHAQGGESWHNYGCAVDVAPFDAGIPDWNPSHPAWARIVTVGESLGLVSGISWSDKPHFQYTGPFAATPNQDVKDLYEGFGGLPAVWDAVMG